MGIVMLERSDPHVRECLERAIAAKQECEEAATPDSRAFWAKRIRSWWNLAASYSLVAKFNKSIESGRF
jgi:hypothetical protein